VAHPAEARPAALAQQRLDHGRQIEIEVILHVPVARARACRRLCARAAAQIDHPAVEARLRQVLGRRAPRHQERVACAAQAVHQQQRTARGPLARAQPAQPEPPAVGGLHRVALGGQRRDRERTPRETSERVQREHGAAEREAQRTPAERRERGVDDV
jgi:hypothetical protein